MREADEQESGRHDGRGQTGTEREGGHGRDGGERPRPEHRPQRIAKRRRHTDRDASGDHRRLGDTADPGARRAGDESFADAAMVLYYWLTLGFVAFRLCTLIARIARTAALPTTRRLSTALLHVGTGLALAASQNLLTVVRTSPRPGSLTETLALGLLAAAAISTGHDLRRKRA
ncbi:hypothetical protein AB5J52_26880 [Streptomyces sp. R39]|uniref:Uncharacterized protein n=1 Tax=Streptomyces sp. R39 TaxID=3238631 RepID=A0AB39QQ35_9ACTN